MDRGGSLRRRLSSLRGAWRWSTGYLFRKVGTSGSLLNQELGGYLQHEVLLFFPACFFSLSCRGIVSTVSATDFNQPPSSPLPSSLALALPLPPLPFLRWLI